MPADRFLRDFFRARRYAGSKDRAAISELVFAIARRRALLAWRMHGEDARRLVIGSLVLEGLCADEIAALFDGAQYGPPRLTDEERTAIATSPSGEPPLRVHGEYPQWLESDLRRAFGDGLLVEMQAMQSRASIDLRANTLVTTRDALAAALHAEGFAVEPTPFSPWGLRLPPGEGSAKLSASRLFTTGHFEFQDEAAQIAALLCAVRPGMRVLDYTAGAGGKTLALAAAMQNAGEITVHDSETARLAQLFPRAKRAGVTIAAANLLHGRFDLVLLDAPCSGTGTWRRQPEQRWRLTPERLAEYIALQDRLLAEVAPYVAIGGRLVYATCSLLPAENDNRVAAFLGSHTGFVPLPAAEVWFAETGHAVQPGMDTFFHATPHRSGTDGFFTAILQRHR
jgi:16S rRNA (cytosine967-C5)-methyltransferase